MSKIFTVILAISILLAGGSSLLAANTPTYSADQVDQMAAPIALYPDALVLQTLMAATFPNEVAEADQWRQANLDIDSETLDEALSRATWDPSVISLCKFPDLLHKMATNSQWTADLGNAFGGGQKVQVLESVQKLRKTAYDGGHLQTTSQQTVEVQEEAIQIRPSDPSIVYVPAYDPAIVYAPLWTSYPKHYYSPLWTVGSGVGFTYGFYWGWWVPISYNFFFGDCDWHHHTVYVNNTIIINNYIYRNAYRHHRYQYKGAGRHVWVRPSRDSNQHKAYKNAPYKGKNHGSIHGIRNIHSSAFHSRKGDRAEVSHQQPRSNAPIKKHGISNLFKSPHKKPLSAQQQGKTPKPAKKAKAVKKTAKVAKTTTQNKQTQSNQHKKNKK